MPGSDALSSEEMREAERILQPAVDVVFPTPSPEGWTPRGRLAEMDVHFTLPETTPAGTFTNGLHTDPPRPELPPVPNDPREQEESETTVAVAADTRPSDDEDDTSDYTGTDGGTPPAMTDQAMRESAASQNLDVLESNDMTLQLDIDSDASWERFKAAWSLLKSLGRTTSRANVVEQTYELLTSKSGNRHVLVRLKEPLPVMERILLQAALGSDPDRELLCWAGARAGKQAPVVLFRPRA